MTNLNLNVKSTSNNACGGHPSGPLFRDSKGINQILWVTVPFFRELENSVSPRDPVDLLPVGFV